MALSSLGDGSSHMGVNVPRDVEDWIMRLCAREDVSRSTIVRSCLVLALPILESLPGLASTVDPGGKRSPLTTDNG